MLKRFRRQIVALLMVAAMILPMVPVMSFAASTSTKTYTSVDGKSVSVEYSNASESNGTFTVEPDSSYDSCTGLTEYFQREATLKVNNLQSGNGYYLKFNYAISLANGGSVDLDGDTDLSPTGQIVLDSATFDIVLKSGPGQGGNSTITFSDFEYFNPNAAWDVTVIGAEHGTVTIGGHTVANNEEYTAQQVKNSDGIAISATPEDGYSFIGLIDIDTNAKQVFDGIYQPTAEVYLTPVFAKTNIDPVFSVGSKLFTEFSEAASESVSAKKPMIPVQDCTLPAGNYSIPNGATLLVPFDEGGTLFKSVPEVIYGSHATPSAYRTLTMAKNAKITVASGGAISVGSKLCSYKQYGNYNGTPTGPGGRIEMKTGSAITLNSGANLYTWGYIYGSGNIEAKSGSTVYEAFQIRDWRGGTATDNVSDYAFIFNQYYIQNIEVPLKINYGANEVLYSSVNASSTAFPIGVDFIGTSSGMFRLKSSTSYLLKDYIEATDQVSYQLYGNAEIQPLVITGVPAIGTVSTSSFRLPLNGGMTIDIRSGKTTIAQDLELLPGTVVSVQQNAEVD